MPPGRLTVDASEPYKQRRQALGRTFWDVRVALVG